MSKESLKNVVECCPFCENEISLEWNINEDGHSIYCPHCGKRIMLCSECPERDGAFHCGWDSTNFRYMIICNWDNFSEKHPEQVINQLTSLINDRKSFLNGECDHDEVFIKDISALKVAIHLLKERGQNSER